MFDLVLILPLFSSITILLFGGLVGTVGSMTISCVNMFLSFVLSWSLFFYSSFDHSYFSDLWTWLSVEDFYVNYSLRYDSLTAIMFVLVTTVSTVVHLYSTVYMYTDPFLSRFMSYLSLFTFFMLLLVSSNNLLVLFMGWEGVGLCSYLLIGFWYTRVQAGKAATKAFAMNKVGDLFLLSGIALCFVVFHSLDFEVINSLIAYYPTYIVETVAMFLFMGAVGKSAQIGLHTWLPDAMEGPTPVSALIHAATMVTAGVFLIIRCSSIFDFAPRMLFVIATWGGITAIVSGIIGSVQDDIKKIIAYSTCSQLGYMVLACGLSMYNVGFFHLLNHGFFKALLFLAAGSVIHLMSNEQDINKMGGLENVSPFLSMIIGVASFALAGFPAFAGYFSKDLIIEGPLVRYTIDSQVLFWIATVGAILTAFYSLNLADVFEDEFGGFKQVIKHYHQPTLMEYILLSFLCVFSLFSGYVFYDIFLGLGYNYFNNFIWVLPQETSFMEFEFIPDHIRSGSTIVGLLLSFLPDEEDEEEDSIDDSILESNKWFFNEFINGYIVINSLSASRHYFEQYEKRTLEQHGPLFLISLVAKVVFTKQ